MGVSNVCATLRLPQGSSCRVRSAALKLSPATINPQVEGHFFMSQQSHLRPVTSHSDGSDSSGSGRGPQRQRATKGLPTDRMKMDRQIRVLRAVGRFSGPRKEPVNAQVLSKAVDNIAPATVILSNRFFADAGWIRNAGKGLYAATDGLVEYMRRVGTDAPDPAELLREPARRAWFWEALEPHLAEGRLSVNEAVILLMHAADASPEHKTMITNVIAWMEHVGLVAVEDGYITATATSTGASSMSRQVEPQDTAESGALVDPAATGEASIEEERSSVPVVMFSLDVRVTVDDLARLTPEQIKAFFEAVGTVAAIRNRG